MSYRSHYPGYDVMNEQHEWDEHTRSIVSSRLIREHGYRWLDLTEAETLRSLCAVLLDDDRADIVQYILCDIDETMAGNKGEGQRKPGVPPAQELVRQGLKDVNDWCMLHHTKYVFDLSDEMKRQLLEQLSQNKAEPAHVWSVPQQALFNKLLSLAIERYCSHPAVWSEIGYGGPAYPRGYVRISGLELDPWEAKKQS